MNVIVLDDFERIIVSDPIVKNVAHCNMSFPSPNSIYMLIVNLFACSSSLNNDNLHSNSNNLPLMEVVYDSDKLMVKKLLCSKEEFQEVLSMEALRKNFKFKTFKVGNNILIKCIDDNCKRQLRYTKLGNLNMFEIRRYYNIHTYALDVRKRDHHHTSFILHLYIGLVRSEKNFRNNLSMK